MAVKILSAVLETPVAQALRKRVEQGGVLSVAGIVPSAHACLTALMRELAPDYQIVAVTAGLKLQEGFHQDLQTWLGIGPTASPSAKPYFYPAWDTLPHEARLPHADTISDRLETLVALGSAPEPKSGANSPPPIIVASVSALMQKTFPPGEVQAQTRAIQKGDEINPLDLIEWLEEAGYEPEAQVTQKGELALRGGILDIFPITSPWPVRLEFFGDTIESIRSFDPHTQMSRESIEQTTISPGGELGLLKKKMSLSQREREGKMAENEGRKKDAVPAEAGREKKRNELASLLDYFGPKTILFLSQPDLIDEAAGLYEQQVAGDDPFLLIWTEFLAVARERGMVIVNAFTQESGQLPEVALTGAEHGLELDAPFVSLEAWRPVPERAPEPHVAEAQRREFFNQLHRWLRQGYDLHVFCNNEGEQQRFTEIWAEYGFGPLEELGRAAGEPMFTAPQMRIGALGRGFLFEPAKLVVVTDAEIFGRYKVQRPRRLKSPHAIAARSALEIDFGELEPGDYVVHLQHGIGRYLGLQVLPGGAGRKPVHSDIPLAQGGGGSPAGEASGEGEECLVIEYAPRDSEQPAPKLYVPITEAHLVSKYVGAGKARRQLNTLGGTRWIKARAQAEEAVRDLASELLAIQAARESQPGFAAGEDTPWQREFESSFIYEETPDQLKAIVDTKKDMESPKPMDRLICGDVGYGKTEVAIRAAFKTVMSGKQVAVLAPTTILVQQHFNTFRERMADYPIRVEQLSRFRSRAEQKRILRQLAEGAIDIVVGTHRLIQEDVVFKQLGLAVVDEEQRFGVMHKEKFKLMRRLVDVLTLSATPIPRTLYLALTGARDLSTIETPPQDRLPVQTIVTQYDERIIREAIQRELNRQGQVFYLHNRVMDIFSMALKIRNLVPSARVVVGHGQMDSDELEEVMTKFVNGEADVLVSTTIIESGIDIPNANTIIIERADRFGLSDLYQLRGRVGRYKHQAYAYLLLPRHAALLSDVRKRISAIKQYSSLGSGFKIAMRDLEIRGAGNLLGAEQSGHITAVGFELYCQLLKQSVSSLKGEKVQPRLNVLARLDFLALSPAQEGEIVPLEAVREEEDEFSAGPQKAVPRTPAYIPQDYIPEPRQRIEMYRKIAQAGDKVALEAVRGEFRDRFGRIPASVELLLHLSEIKLLAGQKKVTMIETRADKLMLTRNNDLFMVNGKFPRLKKKEAKARLAEIKKLLLAL